MQKVDRAKLDRRLQLACMTYTELAKAAGVRLMTVSNMANGYTIPRASTLKKITAVLNCTPADLLQEVEQ